MALKCEVRQSGDVSILDLKGALSLGERPGMAGTMHLLDQVRGLVSSGKTNILLNFAGISLMDSSGIGQLIGTYTSARTHGGRIKILKPSREVREMLELTQLTKVLEVYDDEARALQAFARDAG
ncbi:MAG TPA: STAS domain-containing protein [Candidatus Solibacter sp.]|nr:STAS domain-containing protein [Candidatus Solibacter sp.]